MRETYSNDPGAYLALRTDVRGEDDCWPWLLSTGSHGYGQGFDGETIRLAHSLSWEFWTGERLVGITPDDLTIHHQCYNKLCQNPRHLKAIVLRENARDNGFSRRTHCPHGHEYTKENTRVRNPPASRPGRGFSRACIACEKLRNSARAAATSA